MGYVGVVAAASDHGVGTGGSGGGVRLPSREGVPHRSRGAVHRRVARTSGRPRVRVALAACAVVLTPVVAGCGDDEPTTGPASPSDGAKPTGEESTSAIGSATASVERPVGIVVEVRVADGSATPRGKRVSVAVGEPVTFLITSDVAGELHAHSTPELSLDFEAGSSRHEITLTQPGVVDVELHDPELTIVQLEVR